MLQDSQPWQQGHSVRECWSQPSLRQNQVIEMGFSKDQWPHSKFQELSQMSLKQQMPLQDHQHLQPADCSLRAITEALTQ